MAPVRQRRRKTTVEGKAMSTLTIKIQACFAAAFLVLCAGAARHEFALVYGDLPDSRDKQFIAALPRWVLERA